MNNKINLINIKKAFAIFERFSKNLGSDQEQAGAVQAFEFCYEVAWKLLKKILNSRNLLVASPKETFRQSAAEGLISNVEAWFEFSEKRNLTAHTYDEENMKEVLEVFESFSTEMKNLIATLEQIK